jgi:hypothetical protein
MESSEQHVDQEKAQPTRQEDQELEAANRGYDDEQ